MSFFQLVPVRLSLALVLGILLGYYLEFDLAVSGGFLAILFTFLIVVFKVRFQHKDISFTLLGLLTICALGIFMVGLSNPKNYDGHYTEFRDEGEALLQLVIQDVLKTTAYSNRYLAKIHQLDSTKVSGLILLSVSRDSTQSTLRIDDGFLTYATLKEIKAPLNPHQFDYKNYMEKQGVYHQITIDAEQLLKLKGDFWTLSGIASNFRDAMIQKLKKRSFGQEELAVIEALLLGQRNDLTDATYDKYKNAGAVHILALSGLHIGILLVLLQFLLSPLKRWNFGKRMQFPVILLSLWAFAFIAGLSPSIVRAVTMFSFVAYALYLNRPTNTINVVAWSFFFLLLVWPMFLFQVGFQMSYAAVFAIVWLYPKLQRFWYPPNIVLRKIWQLLAVSCTAQLGVLPISLFYFHQFPGLFFISNLVIVPLLGIILGMGIVVIVLSQLSILPKFMVAVYDSIIGWMNQIVAWVARQEAFVIQEISFDAFQLFLAYFLILALVFAFLKPRFRTIVWVLTASIGMLGYAIVKRHRVANKEEFVVAHQTANSLLLHQKGKQLTVFLKNEKGKDYVVKNYSIAENIDTVTYTPLKNSYHLGKKSLFVLDSTGIYPQKEVDYLLLTGSPKVNLSRVLDSLAPKKVLMDGSNYQNSVAQWKQTCLEKNIPFHHTGEKGAYYFEEVRH